jgi:hypothetical protein
MSENIFGLIQQHHANQTRGRQLVPEEVAASLTTVVWGEKNQGEGPEWGPGNALSAGRPGPALTAAKAPISVPIAAVGPFLRWTRRILASPARRMRHATASTVWLAGILLLALARSASPVVMEPPLTFPDDFGAAPGEPEKDDRMHLAITQAANTRYGHLQLRAGVHRWSCGAPFAPDTEPLAPERVSVDPEVFKREREAATARSERRRAERLAGVNTRDEEAVREALEAMEEDSFSDEAEAAESETGGWRARPRAPPGAVNTDCHLPGHATVRLMAADGGAGRVVLEGSWQLLDASRGSFANLTCQNPRGRAPRPAPAPALALAARLSH